jgi:hypothetical protein
VLPLDTFHTIAEVGIAITGFAGIVAAIRGGAVSAGQRFVADPLGLLLGSSLGTVFFCLVPEWFHAAIASPDAVCHWRPTVRTDSRILRCFSSTRSAGQPRRARAPGCTLSECPSESSN